jgi:hypothetical protein
MTAIKGRTRALLLGLEALIFARRHVTPRAILAVRALDKTSSLHEPRLRPAGSGKHVDRFVKDHPTRLVNIDRQRWDEGIGSLQIRGEDPPVHHLSRVFMDPRFSCLYDREGRRIESTVRVKGPDRQDNSAPKCPTYLKPPRLSRTVGTPVVWLGELHSHYGHFLLEGIARLWYALREGSPTLVAAPERAHRVPEFRDTFLRASGLTGQRLRVPLTTTWFDDVIVPGESMIYRGHSSASHGDIPRLVADRLRGPLRTEDRQPVYLSRQRLHSERRRAKEEVVLERELERAGFAIISPEALLLPDQIAIFEESSLVAGMLGSAFHSVLMGRRDGARMVYLTRTDQSPPTPYATVDALVHTDATYVGCLRLDEASTKPGFDRDVRLDVDIALEGIRSAM